MKQFNPVKSLQKGLTILDLLGRHPEGLDLKQIAEVIGSSSPAAYNLVQTMVAAGYAERRDKPIRYALGPRLHDFASQQSRDGLYNAVDSTMQSLAAALPQLKVCFCESLGGQLMITRQASLGPSSMVTGGLHHALPPYTSAACMVHLAFWPETVAQKYRDDFGFDTYGAIMWQTRENLEENLRKVRDQRYVFMPSMDPCELKLGLPVLRENGVLEGSLTLQWNQASPDAVADVTQSILSHALPAIEQLSQQLRS